MPGARPTMATASGLTATTWTTSGLETAIVLIRFFVDIWRISVPLTWTMTPGGGAWAGALAGQSASSSPRARTTAVADRAGRPGGCAAGANGGCGTVFVRCILSPLVTEVVCGCRAPLQDPLIGADKTAEENDWADVFPCFPPYPDTC